MNTTATHNRVLARTVLAALAGFAATSLACGTTPSAPSVSPTATTPVAPAPVPLEGISLVATPTVVLTGEPLTIAWTGPAGRGCIGGGDWIALYRVGDPDETGATNGHSDIWFEHLCGAASGTFRLAVPPFLAAGAYEFRYMVSAGSVARSNPVTVDAAPSPPALAPALIIDGGTSSTREIEQTFWYSGTGYTAGATVTRYITPAVNGSKVLTPTLAADASGRIGWSFTPRCGNPKSAYVVYAVDDATGRETNRVTQTVIGSASCP